MALKRHLGVSYPTAWLMPHKLMQAMAERGSKNKISFVATVSMDDEGHPLRVKLTPVPGFTLKAITDWSKNHSLPAMESEREGW